MLKFLDLTLPTPAENLACDEALLNACDTNETSGVLRFWESPQYFVVVGYANKIESEVDSVYCLANNVPILRRCSGGGTVLQGPGCLNYSLILNWQKRESLKTITETNRFVMMQHRDFFHRYLKADVEIQGHTDLVARTPQGWLKFSGNAQRRMKSALLFHGTFLLNFDIALIQQSLKMPSQQPDYRKDRSHKEFLMNLFRSPDAIKAGLRKIWGAEEELNWMPPLHSLLKEKYLCQEWHHRF